MKTLLLMRHAKSSWDNAYLSDHARPLNKRGNEAAPQMGKLLRDHDLIPDCILTSSAVRALETATHVADACEFDNDMFVMDDLYHSSPSDMAQLLVNMGEGDTVLIVAHNPGMEMILTQLSGVHERFITAAIAHFAIDIETWSQFELDNETAELLHFWRPSNSKT